MITDFGRTSNLVESSRLRAQSQQESATATRAGVLLQVNRAYLGVLRAQTVLWWRNRRWLLAWVPEDFGTAPSLLTGPTRTQPNSDRCKRLPDIDCKRFVLRT